MERGVEAGDLCDVRRRGPHLSQRGERRRLVQGSQRAQRPQLLEHLVGDDHRIGERRPAVHNPVPDRAELAEPCQIRDRGGDLVRVRPALPRAKVDSCQRDVARPEEPELQAG